MHLKKTAKIGIIIIISIFIIGGFYLITHKGNSQSITFVDESQRIIEYGTQNYDAQALIKEIDGTLVKKPIIDTSKIGKQEIEFVVEKDGKTNEINCTIEIKDTKGATITLQKDHLEISTKTNYDPLSNVISIQDALGNNLTYIEEKEVTSKDQNYYTYTTDLDIDTTGTYSVDIKAVDVNGVVSQKSFAVEVSKQVDNHLFTTYESDVTQEANTPTYINGVLIVNKRYGLPRNYGETDPTAFAALEKLQAAAYQDGYDIPTISGYRDYETQVGLYNAYVERDGQAAADRYSARPGFSEHQSGLCFDIGDIDDNYGDTVEGTWLAENAHTYGYIIRYPKGKEGITGYMYEPWHVRYVGVEIATEIYKNNATLEEYLDLL